MQRPCALLSVYDKTGIVEFAQQLIEMGWDILASGGTRKVLADYEVPSQDIADLVGGKSILGHRVVTLSREVHAGLLADPTVRAHVEEMAELGLRFIDLVCVDMYPLEEEIAKPDCTLQSVIEKTDIGGPTMLRSGVKGQRIVICDPKDRQEVIRRLRSGELDETFREELATKAEFIVGKYCLASARYRRGVRYSG